MAGRVMELAIAIRGRLEGSVGASMRAAAQEAARLRSQISNVNREMREAQRAAEAERRATGHVSEATLQRLAALQARLNHMTERRTQILEAQANVERRGAAFENAKGKLSNAVMTTAVLAAPLVAATKAAMDFESAMADVRKVVDFDSPQGFQNMSNDILALSQRLPMAAEDIAKIVAAGGQSGIAAGDLMQFAEAATKMGIAFDVTADQAGDMMAKWRTAFGLSQDGVVDLADKINYLGNTTAASAPLISDVVTRIGPLGEIGGVASGEIAALGASMVGVGIPSDVAATGIKNLILSMTAGESATKSQADAFQQLGFDAATMAQRMQTDAKGAIMDVFRALQALPKDQQAAVLSNLFGKESLSAIAPLLSNLDNLSDNFNKVADASQYAGSMEAEYAARSQTTQNQLQLAKNSLMAVAIAIGSAILPAVNQMLSVLAPIAQSFAAWAGENKTIVQVLVAVAAAIAGVVIAALSVYTVATAFQYMNATIALLRYAMEGGANAGFLWAAAMRAQAVATRIAAAAQAAFNAIMAANPIALAVLAVVALVGAIVYLYNTNETVRNAVLSAWESIKSAAIAVWTVVSQTVMQAWEGIKQAAQPAIAYLQGVWTSIQPQVSVFGSFVVSMISGLVGILGSIFSGIVTVIGTYLGLVITVVGGIVQAVVTVFSFLLPVVGAIFGGIVSVVSGAIDLISGLFSGVSSASSSLFGGLAEIAASVWAGITATVQAAIGIIASIVAVLSPVFSAIWTGITYAAKATFVVLSLIVFAGINVIGSVLRVLVSIASAVWQGIVAAAQFAWALIAPIVQFVVQTITTILQNLQMMAATIWNGIVAAATFAWNLLAPIVSAVLDGIMAYLAYMEGVVLMVWNNILAVASAAWQMILAVVMPVIDTINYYVQYAQSVAEAAWYAILAAADAAWNAIVGTVQGVIDSVIGIIDEGVGYVEEKWNHLKSIFSSPISAVVNFIKGGDSGAASAVDVSTNATGGIYEKGAFLTTFAEQSAEAAIPLDGSRRAISLWMQAGARLGTLPQTASQLSAVQAVPQVTQFAYEPQAAETNVVAAPAPQASAPVTLSFNPTITVQGGAGQDVEAQVRRALEDFYVQMERRLPRMMDEAQASKRRLSYG